MEITAPTPKPIVPLTLPLQTRIILKVISTLSDTFTRRNGTVHRHLINLFNLSVCSFPIPVNGVKSHDITVDRSRNLWFRIYIPTVVPSAYVLPLVVFFHGGGFVFFTAASISYDAALRRFARVLPAIVVSVNYRLAPEYKCPTMYEDGFDVLRFLDENESVKRLLPGNVDFSHCFLAGDSAGGNIAHHVAVKASKSKFQQIKLTGIVSLQPFFGGEERTEAEESTRLKGTPLVSLERTDWMWRAFLPPGEGYNRDYAYINVSGPNAIDISSLEFPATLVIVAGYDILQDWQRRYYEWLKKSGKEAYLIEYPNMCHDFFLFPKVPESAQVIEEVSSFIKKKCSNVEA